MLRKYSTVQKNHEKLVNNLSSKLEHDHEHLKSVNEVGALRLKELSRKRLEEIEQRAKGYS